MKTTTRLTLFALLIAVFGAECPMPPDTMMPEGPMSMEEPAPDPPPMEAPPPDDGPEEPVDDEPPPPATGPRLGSWRQAITPMPPQNTTASAVILSDSLGVYLSSVTYRTTLTCFGGGVSSPTTFSDTSCFGVGVDNFYADCFDVQVEFSERADGEPATQGRLIIQLFGSGNCFTEIFIPIEHRADP